MNVAHLLINQAATRPEAAAIIEGSVLHRRSITFRELNDRSARAAAMLAESGLRAGDSVLVFVPMSIDLYVALIALFRTGAIAMFCDPSAGRTHIARCCEMLSPRAMIAVSKAHLLRLTTPALRRIPLKFAVGWPVLGARTWRRLVRHAPSAPIVERHNDDAALITFTSGSTGLPKAAVRSHGFLAAQHAALREAIHLTAGQIDLATLPVFSLANLASGVTSVIPDADLRRPGAIEPAGVLAQVSKLNIDRAVASPAFFERLLRSPDAPESLRSIRRLYTGGAPVFPGLMRRLRDAMPAAEVVALYGSTEAEPIAHISWRETGEDDLVAMFAGRGLLAGPPVPQIALRILPNRWGTPLAPMTRIDLERLACKPDEPGEIVVTGDHVLRGYLGGAGDEETKFRVDEQIWHRTGDAGYLDARGRLWLLGRASVRIADERGVIYPFAVETAASQIDGVARSALVAIRGRRVLAVQPTRTAPVELADRIRERLIWAQLDDIRLLPLIPVDARHNAKIDYPALLEHLLHS